MVVNGEKSKYRIIKRITRGDSVHFAVPTDFNFFFFFNELVCFYNIATKSDYTVVQMMILVVPVFGLQ